MKKKVNIYPRGPITSVNPPIRVPVKNITKDVKDIRRCIMAGAKVEECTPNGTIELNLSNYDLDNGADYKAIETGLKMSLIDKDVAPVASGLAETKAAPDTAVPSTTHTFEKPEVLKEKIAKVKEDIKLSEETVVKVEEEAKTLDKEHAKEEAEAKPVEKETDKDESEGEIKPEERNLTAKQRRALRRYEQRKKDSQEGKTYQEFVKTIDPENDDNTDENV